MNKPFTLAAIAIFVIVALMHLLRLLFGWSVTIAGIDVRIWASGEAKSRGNPIKVTRAAAFSRVRKRLNSGAYSGCSMKAPLDALDCATCLRANRDRKIYTPL